LSTTKLNGKKGGAGKKKEKEKEEYINSFIVTYVEARNEHTNTKRAAAPELGATLHFCAS
jgi:hypothetical protein